MKITAIIVAAGKGLRMKNKENKPFLPLAEEPLLVWTLKAFVESRITDMVIAVNPTEVNRVTDLINEYEITKVAAIIPGGVQRQDSVANALDFSAQDAEIIAVHDGARPLVTAELINKTIESLRDSDGVIPVVKPVDTIKRQSEGFISKTLPRQDLVAAQTPQVFKRKPLIEAYEKARQEGFYGTDDASLLEHYDFKVRLSKAHMIILK